MAELRTNLADLKLIIIDEISLVSADMLYTIHMRLKEIFQTPLTVPFANLNIVLVGDLLQIAPVQGTLVFKTPLNIKYEANKDTLDLWNCFKPMILQHNHRQGDEKEWADALNEFRVGIVSEKGDAMLRERQTTEQFLVEDAMHIFYRNKNVKGHNDRMLNSLPSNLVSIVAAQALPKGCYSSIDKDKGTIGSTQFLEVLNIKIGARVALIFNVNIIDDLVNGSYGTVVGIERKGDKVHCIIVQFDDEKTGREQRQKYPISNKYKDKNGTPIFRKECEYQVKSKKGYSHNATAKLFQFPLSLCYAQTSHRMQGQTVKAESKVVIHWSKVLQKGMAYVMLGRPSRRQDMYIAGKLDTSQIKCDQDALEESQRLQTIFDDTEAEKSEKRSKTWKISYLNVRSLNAHILDIEKDNFIMDSDLLGLGETWLDEEETKPLNGFTGSFANFGKGKGVAGYNKMNLVASPVVVSSKFYSTILFKTLKFDVIFLYLSNDYNKQEVFEHLEHLLQIRKPMALLGDINENALENSVFETFMRGKGFYQMVNRPTRESGKLLDHIYVNDGMDELGFTTQVDVCYYSDHDIVSLYVSNKNKD